MHKTFTSRILDTLLHGKVSHHEKKETYNLNVLPISEVLVYPKTFSKAAFGIHTKSFQVARKDKCLWILYRGLCNLNMWNAITELQTNWAFLSRRF